MMGAPGSSTSKATAPMPTVYPLRKEATKMSSQALVPTDAAAAMQLAFVLGARLNATGLELTNPELDYEGWENIGRAVSFVGTAWQWWIGDWVNLGEELFGEEAAQAVEHNTSARYSKAEAITGVDHGRMMNIASVCRKIARSRRRSELSFSHHEAVSALEPEEQTEWLSRCIEEEWTREELRQAIRDTKNPPEPEDDDGGAGGDGANRATVSERIEEAARLVFHQAQSTSDGTYLVPPEPMKQLAAALGEE